MEKKNSFSRRSMIKTAAVTLAGAAVGSASCAKAGLAPADAEPCCPSGAPKPSIEFDNASFYGEDGKFDVEKGKDAIMAICAYHGYPVFPGFRDGLWVSDYNTGQFTDLGLAAFMYQNNVDNEGRDGYMLMDLFLLPGQMLPEHWHLAGEGDDAGNPAKNEGWLVRWGESLIVGVGEPNLEGVTIPKIHMGGTTETEHGTTAKPGMFVPLAEVGTKHWQLGGEEGAIITEVANGHTDSAVRHNDEALNDYFLNPPVE